MSDQNRFQRRLAHRLPHHRFGRGEHHLINAHSSEDAIKCAGLGVDVLDLGPELDEILVAGEEEGGLGSAHSVRGAPVDGPVRVLLVPGCRSRADRTRLGSTFTTVSTGQGNRT